MEEREAEILRASLRCPACGVRAMVEEGIGAFLPGDAEPAGTFPDSTPRRPAETTRLEVAGGSNGSGRADEIARVVESLADAPEPIVQFLSGSAEVARALLQRGDRRPVVSDGSWSDLRELGGAWTGSGIPPRWDALAFEIHSMPFSDRSLGTAVVDLALQGVPGTHVVLRELRRVVRGRLYATVGFVAPEDEENRRWLRARGLEAMFLEERCLRAFRRAGWTARLEHSEERPVTPAEHGGGDPEAEGFPFRTTSIRRGLLIAE